MESNRRTEDAGATLQAGAQQTPDVQQDRELAPDEIQQQQVADLPDREAMSILDTGLLDSSLLNLDLNLDLGLNATAPVNAAAAANANVAAPINASVGASIGSPDSIVATSATQNSVINQDLHGIANAVADQTAKVDQTA